MPEKTVNTAIEQYMQKYAVPGIAVGLYLDGKSYFYNFGYEDEAKTKKISQDTVFEIGSITKSFVATLLALEILKKNVRLNDRLKDYIKLPPKSALGTVTLKQLATHTSGLPRKAPLKKSQITQQRVLSTMSDWQSPVKSPHYRYSNLGYNLLGYALESAAKKTSYEELIEQEITKPLKMFNTNVIRKQKIKNYAQGYSKDGAKSPPVHNGIGAAGALRSTTNDMMLFLKANLGITGYDTLIKALQITHKPCYKIDAHTVQALSWQRYTKGGITIIDKNGGVGGFSTWMGFDTKSQTGLIILTTRRNFHVTQLGRSLLSDLVRSAQRSF